MSKLHLIMEKMQIRTKSNNTVNTQQSYSTQQNNSTTRTQESKTKESSSRQKSSESATSEKILKKLKQHNNQVHNNLLRNSHQHHNLAHRIKRQLTIVQHKVQVVLVIQVILKIKIKHSNNKYST